MISSVPPPIGLAAPAPSVDGGPPVTGVPRGLVAEMPVAHATSAVPSRRDRRPLLALLLPALALAADRFLRPDARVA